MPLITASRADTKALIKKVTQRFKDPKVRFRFTIPGDDDEGWRSQEVMTVEDQPRVVTITYKHWEGGDDCFKRYDFRLWKPYSYMNVHFNPNGMVAGAHIFFSYSRIKSEHDAKLFLTPLPNIGYDNHPTGIRGICLGHVSFEGLTEAVAVKVERHFWKSTFNDEMTIEEAAWPNYLVPFEDEGPALPLLQKWHEKSEAKLRVKFKRAYEVTGTTLLAAATRLVRYWRHEE